MPSPMQLSLRSAVALTLAFTLAGGPVAASAATTAQIDARRSQATQVEASMQKTRADLAIQITELGNTSGALAQTRQQIDGGAKRLAVLAEKLGRSQQALGARAAFTYRSGGTELLDMLFDTMSFADFVDRLDLLARIAEHDAQLIAEVKSARTEATQLQAALKTREAQLVEQRSQADARRAAVQGTLDKQQATLRGTSADVAAMVLAQERAQAVARTPSRSTGGGGGGSPHGGGGGGVVSATVDGLTGTWLAMAGEPTHYRTTGASFSGEASWYSVAENGTGTASGRPLDDSELTCAHPSLPFGTRLAVSCGGHRVIVVVTDRGPYSGGRVLDLNKRAHDLLGFDGTGGVHAEVIQPAS